MESPDAAYLDIRLSTAPGTLWRKVCLVDDVTPLGRPEVGQPGVDLVLKTISRQHGRIVRERTGAGTTYFLENVRGRAGIRLYEVMLHPGEPRYALCHGYIFHIPGVLEAPNDPYLLLTFCMDANRTSYLAIMFDQRPNVSVFGQIVKFRPQEYALLAYLYTYKNQLCLYHDIIANVLVDKPRTPDRILAYRDQLYADRDAFLDKHRALDTLVSRVRDKIRLASGGVSLIETVWGEGLCLRT